MAKRTTSEVLARNEAGEKQCGRCEAWLPENVFSKHGAASDGLQSRCNRCSSDSYHCLPVERRTLMISDQDGMCMCGFVFDVYGGIGLSYEIDHDHNCCPGRLSCGECIRALVCSSCNKRDRLNLDRTGYTGSTSKYRGVCWHKPTGKWRVKIGRSGKNFSPTVIDRRGYYDDEDEAGRVAAQLEAWLDANPQLWRAA